MPASDTSNTPDNPIYHVPLWMDWLSGNVEQCRGFWTWLGNLESRALADRLDELPIEQPIYITGLARAGTTILLELLSRHPAVAAHRYRDFPAVPTPYWWNRIVERAATDPAPARERAHGDGIYVTQESPEAFEETIWMAFFPTLHTPEENNLLGAATRHPDFERFYRDHIRKLLMVRGAPRYLAKNNYNLTRLAYLVKLFPDARFVVPIRHPYGHIASLMKQHERFCEVQQAHPRVLRHMRRVGHFEFGLDRRPINPDANEAVERIVALWAMGWEIEGWALYWSSLYGQIAALLDSDPALRKATLLLRYEDLCAAPAETMLDLAAHCDLAPLSLPEQAAQRIRRPRDPAAGFSAAERAAIARHAGGTAACFGYEL